MDASETIIVRRRTMLRLQDLLHPPSDDELIRLKREHNAATLMGRLPAEIWEQIVRLVQDRPGLQDYTSQMISALRLDHAWMFLLRVCSYLRNIIVYSPGLWVCLNLRWSKPWMNLCIARAKALPLRFSCALLRDGTNVSLALALFSRSEAAAVHFPSNHRRGTPPLQETQTKFLDAPVLSLRALRFHCGRTMPLPIMFSIQFPHLVHLDLQKVTLGDGFTMPRGVRWLRMTYISISNNLARLKHLFGGLPTLEHLEMRNCTIQSNTPVRTWYMPDPKPQLHSLVMCECATQLSHAVVKALDPPLHTLELVFSTSRAERRMTTADIELDMYSFAHRFWSRATGDAQMPPVALSSTGDYCISANHRHGHEPSLRLSMPYSSTLAHTENPFLPSVTSIEWLREDIGQIFGPQSCTLKEHVPALCDLKIRCARTWEAVDLIQAWADAYARVPVNIVFQTPNYSPHTDILWNTHAGPLSDVDWNVYKAAEARPASTIRDA